MNNPRTSVLLVDDNPEDTLLMRLAWSRASVPNPLTTVLDGNEAIEILQKGGDKICLILLDIKMPQMDGFQLLKWIKSSPALEGLQVIMLSASSIEGDRITARNLGADSYLVKPSTFSGLLSLVETLHRTFLTPPPHQSLRT